MGRIWLDVRYSLRGLRRYPAFSAIVVLTIGLGIGGSAAIFSFVDGILLRPLPYTDEGRIVMLCETHPEQSPDRCGASPGNLDEWSRRSRATDAMGLARDWPFMFVDAGKSSSVRGGIALSSLFQVLGARPAMGRLLDRADSDPGRESVALVSDAFWRERLGADPHVLGRRIQIDDAPRTVVGVLPPGFGVPSLEEVEVWIPLWPERTANHGWRGFTAYAHLAGGSTLAQARAEMAAIRAEIEPAWPEANRGWGLAVDSLRERTVRSVRPTLMIFLGAVGLTLVIACANVANLMMAQGASREKEFVVRAALGARPRRLVHQVLVESLVLALLGGAFGWLAGFWATDTLKALAPAGIPRLENVRVGGSVLLFALLLSAATGLLFGLLPAWQASRPSFNDVLREGRHAKGTRRGGRIRDLLVAAEVAVALVLLIGAGLLVRSYRALLDWEPGFDQTNLATISVFCSPAKYPKAESAANLMSRIEEGLRSVPGIVSAAAASAVPLRGGDGSQEFKIEGRPEPAAGERPSVFWFDVGPDYFRTAGIPLKKGRFFTDADDERAPRVAIVNETMARRHWPGGDAVGRRIRLVAHEMTVEIVGVVGDVKPFRPDRHADPQIYWPYRQAPRWASMFAIRGAGDPALLFASIRAKMAEIDPELGLGAFVTMDELAARQLVGPRFNMLLLGLFALLALALATAGVYGVISRSVELRSHEIGVRLALGARRAEILRMIVAGGMRWTLAGVAAGLAAAPALTLALQRLLITVSPRDPFTFGGVAILIAGVALAACLVPALRATRVDPMAALRCE